MLRLSIAIYFTFFILAPSSRVSADTQSEIASIRKLYAKIEGARPLRSQKFEFNVEGGPMEGTITRDEYEGALIRITLSYVSSDHGGADQTFYFGSEGLFFAFEVASSWKFGKPAPNGDSTTIDRRIENRFYFAEGQCIRQLRRSAQAADAKQLPRLIGDEKNVTVEPGEEAATVFKRALALRGITTGDEAARYFELE